MSRVEKISLGMSTLYHGDACKVLRMLRAGSVHCCVTSPPYWGLRDYGVEGAIGREKTPKEYVAKLVEVFREVRRVLRDDATLWLNMGDSYAKDGKWGGETGGKQAYLDDKTRRRVGREKRITGLKPKDVIGIPWRVAFALQADGWWLRSDIIWAKPNPTPESGRCSPANVDEDGKMVNLDRPTKAHEHVFLLSKSAQYFYDAEAVREASQPDPRDKLWGTTRETSRHDHKNDPAMGMSQIRTEADGFVRMSNPAGRNRRDVWTIPTQGYPDGHFATFPEKLVEPCIKAGTSQEGRCPECGAPWQRIVEKERIATRPARDNVRDETGLANRDYERHVTSYKPKGWQPMCECKKKPVPCVVLDPFIGSGTTALVAARLGRRCIGIELNGDYVELAKRRIGGEARQMRLGCSEQGVR